MKNRAKTITGFVIILMLLSACDKHKMSKKENAKLPGDSTLSSARIQSPTISADQIPDLKQIEHPTVDKIVVGQAYIDTIQKVTFQGNQALLVKGNLPDGCSKLYESKATINDSTLTLHIKTWKPQHLACTQALVPFSYLYQGLSLFEFNSVSQYKAGNKLRKF